MGKRNPFQGLAAADEVAGPPAEARGGCGAPSHGHPCGKAGQRLPHTFYPPNPVPPSRHPVPRLPSTPCPSTRSPPSSSPALCILLFTQPPSPPQLTLRLLPVGKTPTLLPPEDQLPPRMSLKTPDARGLVCTPHLLPDKGTPQSAPKSTKSLYAAVAKRCPSFGWMWFRC